MTNNRIYIRHYYEEYKESMVNFKSSESIDWRLIKMILVDEHSWTEQGASALVLLIGKYGSFILSHALALSLLLKQEDGELEI